MEHVLIEIIDKQVCNIVGSNVQIMIRDYDIECIDDKMLVVRDGKKCFETFMNFPRHNIDLIEVNQYKKQSEISRLMFYNLVSEIDASVFLLKDDKIIDANQPALKLFDITIDQIKNKNMINIINQYATEKSKNYVNKEFSGPLKLCSKNGDIKYVNLKSRAIDSKEGSYKLAIIKKVEKPEKEDNEKLRFKFGRDTNT